MLTTAIRGRRTIPLGTVLGVALLVVGAHPSIAADSTVSPDPANRLERPIVDLAILETSDPEATPMLLVLDAGSTTPDSAHLALLRRDRAWDPVVEADIQLDQVGLDARWLIGLGEGRFALVATAPETAIGLGQAVVVALQVNAETDPAVFEETGRHVFDRAIESAGAADVDGLGTNELVLGLRPSFEPAGSCGMASLVVLDGASLAIRRSIDLPGRIGGGAIGRWDGALGDDLLVYASPDCPPGGATHTRLAVVRLTDATETTIIDGLGQDVARYPAPVRFQVDGEGLHRALSDSGDGLAIVDGTGRALTIQSSGSVPLLAGPAADAEGPATRIAWWDEDGLHAERIRSGPRGLLVEVDRTDLARDTVDVGRWDLLTSAIWNDMAIHGLTSAWLGDVVDEGCPDLILPMAILPCDTDVLQPGAAWLATRPVAAMQIEGRRRLLVAAGLGWDPTVGAPATPQPLASGPAGWWRHGPSVPFALSEVRALDVVYFRDYPVPQSTIEVTTDQDATTALPGFTGTRLFVTISPLGEGEEGPDVAPTASDALRTMPDRGGIATVVRVPVPPGNESGRDGSFARLGLSTVTLAGGEPASRWALRVVPINDWGEVGFAVVRTIVRDAVGPTLSVESPFTSPIWPVPARLAGAAEPGSTVTVEGIGEVAVDRRGRFAIETTLAPWPQVIRVTATDVSGNRTIRDFSIVGGIDYRRFPWPLLGALGLLLVVAVRGLYASGRGRGSEAIEAPRSSTFGPDEQPVPEIEELPPGSGLARR